MPEKPRPFSHWNYRIIKRKHEDGEITFGVHEVYYDMNANPVSCTEDAMDPMGGTEQELKDVLKLMLEAFRKPVLAYELFHKSSTSEGF